MVSHENLARGGCIVFLFERFVVSARRSTRVIAVPIASKYFSTFYSPWCITASRKNRLAFAITTSRRSDLNQGNLKETISHTHTHTLVLVKITK